MLCIVKESVASGLMTCIAMLGPDGNLWVNIVEVSAIPSFLLTEKIGPKPLLLE